MAVSRNKISPSRRIAVYRRDKWTCQYCGRTFKPCLDGSAPMEMEQRPGSPDYDYVWLEIDHIRPVIHSGTNEMYNLRAACSPCNRRKSAFLGPDEWRAKFTAVANLLTDLEPSEQSAQRLISVLLGRPVTVREIRKNFMEAVR